jgi:hypothetical protein
MLNIKYSTPGNGINISFELKYVKHNALKEWHPFIYHDNTWSMEMALHAYRNFSDNEAKVLTSWP